MHSSSSSVRSRPDPLVRLADYLRPRQIDPEAVPYFRDPVAWVHDIIRWRPGQAPTEYQNQILADLPVHGRVSVRGPHGIGKTAIMAWVVLWFADTRDRAGADWKSPTTASAWRQLTHYLWPEIRKWSRQIDWTKLGRLPFTRHELLEQNLKLRTGEAFAVASNDAALIEGVHADHVLYVFDEAKTIPADTFDAAEGAFAGAGSDTAAEALGLAFSTPGEPNGRFADIHHRKPGLEDWHTIHVTLDDAIAAGRVSRQWADQRARQWPVDSAQYKNRVLGEFASSDKDGVIPLAWVELANERWRIWDDAGRPSLGPLTAVGVDVAREGKDKTVLALRAGWTITQLRRFAKTLTTETTGHVRGVLNLDPFTVAVVDVLNMGAGVVDQLREQDQRVVPFHAGERTDMRDSSGELGFVNKRSAAWWNLRELLDPDTGVPIALPPDDELTGDLTAPHQRKTSGARIAIELKEDIEKRIGRSTDVGDAVVQAFWLEMATPPSVSVGHATNGDRALTAGLMTEGF